VDILELGVCKVVQVNVGEILDNQGSKPNPNVRLRSEHLSGVLVLFRERTTMKNERGIEDIWTRSVQTNSPLSCQLDLVVPLLK
jgi:hypothetical protein